MAKKHAKQPTSPASCTIYVRFPQEDYSEILQQPQLFPTDFQDGCRLKDIRHSKKRNVSCTLG